MTPEQLNELEKLNERWANEALDAESEYDIARDVLDMIPDVLAHIKTAQNEWSRMRVDLEKAIGERDAAQKACAEMRQALVWLESDCMASDFNEHWESYRNAGLVLKNTDCGKGYINVSELESLRVALVLAESYVKQRYNAANWWSDYLAFKACGEQGWLTKALAHAAKLMGRGQ